MKRWVEQIISIPMYITFFPIVPAIVHWDMVKCSFDVKRLRKSSYKEIKDKMLSTRWKFDSHHPDSLFDAGGYPYKNYFHAGIFRFGDVGYLLTPLGYYRASLLQKKIRKTLNGYSEYKKPYVQTNSFQ